MALTNEAKKAAARSFTPPSDADELIAWADHKYESGKSLISETQMKLNLAFILGYQWVAWEPKSRQFVQPRVDTADPNAPVRITSNKVAPLAERTVAKLSKEALVPECRPVTDNDNDLAAAKVGTRTLSSEYTRLDWKAWLQNFLFMPTTYGYSYAHIYWDPSKGDKVGSDDEGDLYEGNICLDRVPAFELSVDPSAKDGLIDAKWCIRETTMTRDAAWDKWDVELEGGARRSLVQEVVAIGGTAGETQGAQGDEWVKVRQLWLRPCKAAPKGLVLTWSENTVIEKKRFPYEHGRLPFEQENILPGIGVREGRTWLTDVLPLQVDYNDALSREAIIRRQLVPMLVAPTGSVDPQRIDARVRVISYNPVGAPPKLEMPNAAWAQQFELGMNRDDADMGGRAGINDASAGQSASSAPAAAILALQEADDTKLAISATELASFVQRVGWHILALARQYWTEERVVRTWSDENVIEAYRYMGSDIEKGLDVHISAESALPKSKAARTQLLMELGARYPDAFDLQTIMRQLDLPGTDAITKSLDIDTRRAVRENSKLLLGEQPPVQPFDNHVIHLQVLNEFRKSADYENLPQEARARWDAHAAVHESLIFRQLGMALPPSAGGTQTTDPVAQEQADRAAAGPAGGMTGSPPEGSAFNAPMYTNEATGVPNSPLAVASGTAPSPLAGSAIRKKAGIGQAAGQPGRVPGIPADNQAASMGG